jgi:hypothetical protein
MTRYQVIVDGAELPATSKREAILVMVTKLIERGVQASAIGEELGARWGTNTEPALTALCKRFSDAGVSFRRADSQ